MDKKSFGLSEMILKMVLDRVCDDFMLTIGSEVISNLYRCLRSLFIKIG